MIYLSGEDPRFYKRRVKQYPARLSGGFQSPTEINAQLTHAMAREDAQGFGLEDVSLR